VSDSEPIRGSISGNAATRSFTGWMQLITALQGAIQEGDTDPGEPGSGADTSTIHDHTAEN
jgi:hypothetical protein